jgi:Concanavalin A-like lectin/glucanases superfamily
MEETLKTIVIVIISVLVIVIGLSWMMPKKKIHRCPPCTPAVAPTPAPTLAGPRRFNKKKSGKLRATTAPAGTGTGNVDRLHPYNTDKNQDAYDIEPSDTTSSLIAYYPFDTDAKDNSSNANDATLVGNPNFIVGKTGSAVSLDGQTQYVTLPASLLTSVIDQFTISFWVNPSVINGTHLFDFGYGNQNKYFCLILSNGKTMELDWATQGVTDLVQLDSGLTLSTGTWYHVVLLWMDSAVTLYVNGIQAGPSRALPDFLWGDSNTNYLGKSNNPNDPLFNGLLDEFKIYGAGLDPTDPTV